MSTQPEIKRSLSVTDKAITLIGALIIFILWAITAVSFIKMPAIIPIHFNIAGEADRYGKKEILFLMPALGTVLYMVFFYLGKMPHLFNYSIPVTEKNALQLYTLSSRMIRVIGISVGLLMIFVVLSIRNASVGNSSLIGSWMLPIVLTLFLSPVVWYLYRIAKMKKEAIGKS